LQKRRPHRIAFSSQRLKKCLNAEFGDRAPGARARSTATAWNCSNIQRIGPSSCRAPSGPPRGRDHAGIPPLLVSPSLEPARGCGAGVAQHSTNHRECRANSEPRTAFDKPQTTRRRALNKPQRAQSAQRKCDTALALSLWRRAASRRPQSLSSVWSSVWLLSVSSVSSVACSQPFSVSSVFSVACSSRRSSAAIRVIRVPSRPSSAFPVG
jgi:hypothetical protein